MMNERGVLVDHSSINRWAIRVLPLIEKASRKHKRAVGSSWRMDETCIKVKGVWKYLYRAVDKQGKIVDFLLTAKRDRAVAKRFFDKSMQANGVPGKVTMDKSGANKAAIDEINAAGETPIIVRQVKYPNNIVEQSHRAAKRITQPMLGFNSFLAAASVLAGIEWMHMIRVGVEELAAITLVGHLAHHEIGATLAPKKASGKRSGLRWRHQAAIRCRRVRATPASGSVGTIARRRDRVQGR
jgi:transposase-like protein